MKLREVAGVNRVAVFLEEAAEGNGTSSGPHHQRLRLMFSVGIPADIRDCLELSRNGGIGNWIMRHGRMLRADQMGGMLTPGEMPRAHHEFEILGCQVAVPITDREMTIGAALLGGHLTRASFSDEDLHRAFRLMEEFGVAVRMHRTRLHAADEYQLLRDIHASSPAGTFVVRPTFEITNSNPAAIRFLKSGSSATAFTFNELPSPIAQRIRHAVEKGEIAEPFCFEEGNGKGRTLRVSLTPLRTDERELPQSVLVQVEELPELRGARKAAVEAANARLTSAMAKRFAHEVKNSLVPLITHLQLMEDRYSEADFRESLEHSLRVETTRISRLSEQILCLTIPCDAPSTLSGIEKLLRESFAKAQEAARTQGILTVHNRSNISNIRCRPQCLSQAFQEIFLNALQSDENPQVVVTIEQVAADGNASIRIGFRDSGRGFTPESAARATEPFFTARNSGLGIGLTVVNRVVLDHGGQLEVHPRVEGSQSPDVVLSFPSGTNHG